MDSENYIVLARHILFGHWIVCKEFQSTESMLSFMMNKDAMNYKVIKGQFIKFKVAIEVDSDPGLNHSQGSESHAKENDQSSFRTDSQEQENQGRN